MIRKQVGHSKNDNCIIELYNSVKRRFSLRDDELEITIAYNTRLVFIANISGVGNSYDNYLQRLTQIEFYCQGFIEAYEK